MINNLRYLFCNGLKYFFVLSIAILTPLNTTFAKERTIEEFANTLPDEILSEDIMDNKGRVIMTIHKSKGGVHDSETAATMNRDYVAELVKKNEGKLQVTTEFNESHFSFCSVFETTYHKKSVRSVINGRSSRSKVRYSSTSLWDLPESTCCKPINGKPIRSIGSGSTLGQAIKNAIGRAAQTASVFIKSDYKKLNSNHSNKDMVSGKDEKAMESSSTHVLDSYANLLMTNYKVTKKVMPGESIGSLIDSMAPGYYSGSKYYYVEVAIYPAVIIPCEKKATKKKPSASLKANDQCLPIVNKITDPIIREMPAGQDVASKTVSGLGNMAKGMMFGGGGGMGNMFGGSGSKAMPKPRGKWTKIGDGTNGIELNGWIYKPRSKKKQPRIRIALRVSDSNDDGTPDTMLLQNIDGRVLTPVSYMIIENWVHWKVTISMWRESYVNGRLVSRKKISEESTSWDEMKNSYAVLMEAPSIWERLGADPFGKLRGIIAEYPVPDDFKPEEWSLVSHVTSKAEVNGKEVIKTMPYIVDLAEGSKKKFSFLESPNGKTQYQIARDCP